MSSQGFDPKDLEEICARKPAKFRMKKADFKELGRNLLLGSVDVAVGGIKATGLVASITSNSSKNKNTEGNTDGFRDGHGGFGFYYGDIKNDD